MAYAAQPTLTPYPLFHPTETANLGSRWEDWKDGFEVMMKAMKIDSEADKRNTLLYYIGSDTPKIFQKKTWIILVLR